MVKYCEKIKPESIVDIFGTVKLTKEKIATATPDSLQLIELVAKKIYVVAGVEAKELPFQLNDASRPKPSKEDEESKDNKKFVNVEQKIRLDNRWIDLRTITNHAIFRIQAGILSASFYNALRLMFMGNCG